MKTTASENAAEQFLIGVLLAIRDGERKAAMGGLLFLFRHFEDGGDMPCTFVNNLLDVTGFKELGAISDMLEEVRDD